MSQISRTKNMLASAQAFWNQYRSEREGVLGMLIVAFFVILALFPQYVAPYPPFELSENVLEPPSSSHILGTDHIGRDIFSRLIWGTQVSFIFGFLAAGISLLLGVVAGALPGYYGGRVDDIVSRATDVFLTIPTLLLVILVVAMFGSDVVFSILVVGLTLWPSNAKITRAQVLSIKNRDYVVACKGMGGSDMRVLFLHILPNGIYPIVANSFVQMAYAILTEASLSFLGLGDLSRVSWGLMIFDAQSRLLSAWWMAIFPGLAITALVAGLNLVGTGINAALNPRLRQREG